MKTFREISRIIAAFVAALFATFLLAGKFSVNATISIYLHDTFYVLSFNAVLFAIFSIGLFILFSVRAGRNHFRKTPQNIMLFIAGIGTLFFFYQLFQFIEENFAAGYTIYPPLSSLGESQDPPFVFTIARAALAGIMLGGAAVVAVLGYALIRWRNNGSDQNHRRK